MTQKSKKKNFKFHYFFDINKAVYFDSFGFEYIPQEVLNKIRDKSITHKIFRTLLDDSIMCGFYLLLLQNIWLQKKLCWVILIDLFLMTIKSEYNTYVF